MPGEQAERDYVLGTHDDEVRRLGLQHRVWQPRVLDAWSRAGLRGGQTVLDLGAGPGFASLDLAGLVGGDGRVIAVDRSRRFLDVLERERDARRLTQVTTLLADLDEDPLPADVDAVWCRWVLAFVQRPARLVERVAASLKSGGVFVAHEYLNYAVWRLLPRSPEFEAFVAAVIDSWRASGGEPDVGNTLPTWLEDNGFAIRSLRPIVDVVTAADPIWAWPAAFFRVGLNRLVSLERLPQGRADDMLRDFERRAAQPGTRLVTPLVLEAIAVKR